VFYVPGLLGYSAVRIVVPCFYALQNSVTPTLVSIFSVALNIVLNLVLVRLMGFRGLALGTSIAALVNAGILLVMLRGRLGGLEGARILGTFVKITVASCLMGVAVWATYGWLVNVAPGTSLVARLLQVFGSIGCGLLVLVVGARLLRLDELEQARRRILSRLGSFPR
jgi:putative peptidoglycan lipid II flippase